MRRVVASHNGDKPWQPLGKIAVSNPDHQGLAQSGDRWRFLAAPCWGEFCWAGLLAAALGT